MTASVDAVPETVARTPPRRVVIRRLLGVIGVSEATAGAAMVAPCPFYLKRQLWVASNLRLSFPNPYLCDDFTS